MDSKDFAAIYRDIVRERDSLDLLIRLWLGRPSTPSCSSPSQIAWDARAHDIERELERTRGVLDACAETCKAQWREAVAREETRERVSLSGVVG